MVYFRTFLSVIIWGAALAFTKRALSEMPPAALLAMRCAMSIIVIRLFSGPLGWLRELSLEQWLKASAAALLSVILTQLLQAYALLHTSAIHAGWLSGSTPIIVAAALALFFGEKIGKLRTAGFLLGFCGVLLVVLSRQGMRGGGIVPTGLGDGIFMASCFVWAAYVIMADRWFSASGFSQVRLTLLCMLLSLFVFTGMAVAGGQFSALPDVSAKGWAAVFYLGLLSSGFAYTFWNIGVEKLGPSSASSFLYFEPFASIVAGSLLLGEKISPYAFLGGVLILSGVYWINGGRAGAGMLKKIYLAVIPE